MMTKELQELLNKQVNYEYYSAYSYLAMAAFAESKDFPGIANFFKQQALEELDHAKGIVQYLFSKDCELKLEAIDKPKDDFDSIYSMFEEALEHEKSVTKKIYKIADQAMDDKEHATISFIKWYIDEQVEEEETFALLVKKVKRAKDNQAALYLLDDELANKRYGAQA